GAQSVRHGLLPVSGGPGDDEDLGRPAEPHRVHERRRPRLRDPLQLRLAVQRCALRQHRCLGRRAASEPREPDRVHRPNVPPAGQTLAQWLQLIGASTTLGELPLQVIRHDYNTVIAPSQSWLTIDDVNFPDTSVQYSFQTPVGAASSQQCGRVLYNDYHVENV